MTTRILPRNKELTIERTIKLKWDVERCYLIRLRLQFFCL